MNLFWIFFFVQNESLGLKGHSNDTRVVPALTLTVILYST